MSRGGRVGLAALACLAWAGAVEALDPRREISQYVHRSWDGRHGLPHDTVRALLQTRDGYLWIGTEGGLARFDGVRFVTFESSRTADGLRDDFVLALAEGEGGTLWVGTRAGGLASFRAGRFTTLTTGDGLPSDAVRSLYAETPDRLWVGTTRGLVLLVGGRVKARVSAAVLPEGATRVIEGDGLGGIWVGTPTGLARVVEGRVTQVLGVGQGLTNPSIRSLLRHASGLWIGTEGGGLGRLEDGAASVTPARVPRSAYVRALEVDREGSLWVATDDRGLSRLSGSQEATFGAREGLGSDAVKVVYEDREGNLWVGAEGSGLHRFRDGLGSTLTTAQGLSADFVRPALRTSDGALWVGTEGAGLNRLHAGTVTTLGTQDGLLSPFVASLHEGRDGSLWVGTEDGGLNQVRQGRVRASVRPGDGLPNPSVWAIEERRDGSLWLGTGAGLAVLSGGSVRPLRGVGLPTPVTLALHEDRSGDLWIGWRNGPVTVLRANGATRYPLADGLPEPSVFTFYEDEEGTLWIGSSRGLLTLRSGALRAFGPGDGLPGVDVHGILEDGDRLWLCTNRGILAVDRRGLLGRLSGGPPIETLALTVEDGLKSNHCSTEAQPALGRMPDGRLFFATVKGLTFIDPLDLSRRGRRLPALDTLIEEVRHGKELLPLHEPAKLPPGPGELLVRFTATSLGEPERLLFRHRLDRASQGWSEPGTRRDVQYTALGAGSYVFRVAAARPGGEWGPSAEFRFEVAPRFYETPPFYAIVAALLGLGVWLGHARRVRAVRHAFAAVLAERARIAREIHDTLLQGFAGVTLQIDSAARRVEEAPGEARSSLERALLRLDECLAEARQSIVDLRAMDADDPGLEVALRRLAGRLTEGSGVEARVEVSGRIPRLPEPVRADVLRIAQEALTNVVRHADASTVYVDLACAERGLVLRVRDDGRGFTVSSAAAPSGHFGIAMMRERAQQIGARLDLRSEPDSGTELRVELDTGRRRWEGRS